MKHIVWTLTSALILALALGCSAVDENDETPPESETGGSVDVGVSDDPALGRAAIFLPKTISPRETGRSAETIAAAMEHTNYFEVIFRTRDNDTGDYLFYGANAPGGAGFIPADVPPGIYDILLLAGYKAEGSAKNLLLASGYDTGKEVVAGRANIFPVTLFSLETAVTVPKNAVVGTDFSVKFDMTIRNPFVTFDFPSASLKSTDDPPRFDIKGPGSFTVNENSGDPPRYTLVYTFSAPARAAAGAVSVNLDALLFGFLRPGDVSSLWAIADSGNSAFAKSIFFYGPLAGYYVDQYGSDTVGDGTENAPYGTVQKALNAIRTVFPGGDWPVQDGSPAPATIYVSGTITAVNNGSRYMALVAVPNAYPPLVLRGKSAAQPGVLDAAYAATGQGVLGMAYASVTIADHLTITRGYPGILADYGGALSVAGGTIRDNHILGVIGVAGSAITMTGGTISGAERGVEIDGGTFALAGGTIRANSYNVIFYRNARVTMTDGTVSGSDRIAVQVGTSLEGKGTFIMTGGALTGNSDSLRLVQGAIDVRTIPPITGSYTGSIPDSTHVWPASASLLENVPALPSLSRNRNTPDLCEPAGAIIIPRIHPAGY